MIGFYVLALGLGIFLLGLPVFVTLWSHSFHIGLIKLYLLSFIGGGIIIWSILPRFERFQAPGLKLNLDQHPPLKKVLQDLSQKTGQNMPDEVYLIFENNAWVQENIGFFGLFRKRRMAIGLPLMHMLSEQEFRAVLAHEYGHYHGGDTRLGAFIYQTRAALFRTVQNMSDNFIGKIFIAYGNMYLKLTHGISRQQEYQADRFAAQHTSPSTMTAALQKVGHLGGSFDHYWSSEVVPVLNSGYKPPIMHGYYAYLDVEKIQQLWKNHYEESNEQEHALQTHPSMQKRIEALSKLKIQGQHQQGQSAISLLTAPETQELQLLKFLGGQEAFSKLKDIDWNTVGERVWVPFWREFSEPHRHLLSNQTLEQIAFQLLDDARRFRLFESMRHPRAPQDDTYPWLVVRFLIAVGLFNTGWHIDARPGESVHFTKGELLLHPLDDLIDMQTGEKRGVWLENLRKMGMQDAILF
ncbi:hypothetical protein GCM10008938_07570 [Deinococcus roseus]|uniref:Peptidase M48 domain-containing protein n=2 Tax=Deinococcus roseus TaxID=392414 RepID=A0ABQ2CV48_9DEIO|nr:hypothetical protein GCM10008938_07570 [Deinococcus roseus]